MEAKTYIPRRLDDQWKIGLWDVDGYRSVDGFRGWSGSRGGRSASR